MAEKTLGFYGGKGVSSQVPNLTRTFVAPQGDFWARLFQARAPPNTRSAKRKAADSFLCLCASCFSRDPTEVKRRRAACARWKTGQQASG